MAIQHGWALKFEGFEVEGGGYSDVTWEGM
jgi:hypothetical protein